MHKDKVGKSKEKEQQQGKTKEIREKKNKKMSHVNSDLFHPLPILTFVQSQ